MSPEFKIIIKRFLLWQLGLLAFFWILGSYIPADTRFLGGGAQEYIKSPLLNSRANFDGNQYLYMSQYGYGYGQQAFFPLYPALIKRLSSLFDSYIFTGVFISSVSFLGGMYVLLKLALLDHSRSSSWMTLWALLVFPTSFFFASMYPEGLFFLLTVSAFYAARKGQWFLVGILGGLASYTRISGVFIFPSLMLEAWTQYKVEPVRISVAIRRYWPLLLIPVGLLTYMQYLDRTTGDPFAFLQTANAVGQTETTKLVMLYQVFWRYIKMLFSVSPGSLIYPAIALEFITAVIFAALALMSLLRQRPSYAIFNLLTFLTPTLAGNFTSLPRFVLLCFPSFLLIGTWLSTASPWARRTYWTVSLIGLAYFMALFGRGNWVA